MTVDKNSDLASLNFDLWFKYHYHPFLLILYILIWIFGSFYAEVYLIVF